MKTGMSQNNEQDSLQAKELQKFFSKVKGVMLIPKGSKLQLMDYAVLCLLLDEETFINFKDYGINKIIVDLLDNKYPLLSIKTEDSNTMVGLSIVDKDCGLTFKLPDQSISESLFKFLQETNHDDRIPIMLGYFKGDNLVFDQTIKSNLLLILDGYIFE
jgi:hypothetical protein